MKVIFYAIFCLSFLFALEYSFDYADANYTSANDTVLRHATKLLVVLTGLFIASFFQEK